jgi:hypothetical protein
MESSMTAVERFVPPAGLRQNANVGAGLHAEAERDRSAF